jgi:hypothetical protein
VHLAEVGAGLGPQHGLAHLREGRDAARTVRPQLAVVLGPDLALAYFLHVAAGELPLTAQLGQAGGDVDHCIGIGIGPAGVVDPQRRLAARRLQRNLAHRHAQRPDVDLAAAADRAGGDADLELGIDVGHETVDPCFE